MNKFHTKLISIFNVYQETPPKLTNELIEKLFSLIISHASNGAYLTLLNNDRIINFIFDNLSQSSIDQHIILALILLRFRPLLSNEKIETILTRVVTMFNKSDDDRKSLIISNFKWIIHYHQNSLVSSIYSPLILVGIDGLSSNADLKSSLEKVQLLNGKEKYLKQLISEFIQNTIVQMKFKNETISLLEMLLASPKTRKYVKLLVDHLSLLQRPGLSSTDTRVLKYLYYQGFTPDLIEFQNLLFKNFQLVCNDFNKLNDLEEEQLDTLIDHYKLPKTNKKEEKITLLRNKVTPTQVFEDSLSFNQHSVSESFQIPNDIQFYSDQELKLRLYHNLRFTKFHELKEHLLRTAERIEITGGSKITGNSKYVIKPNPQPELKSKLHILSSSLMEYEVELNANSHGLKLKEPVILVNLVNQEKSSSDEFKKAGLGLFLSGTVSKIINNNRAIVTVHKGSSINDKEELKFNLAVKLPENLKLYYDELYLAKSLTKVDFPTWFKGDSPQTTSDTTKVIITSCTIKQLHEAFPHHIIERTSTEPANKRRKPNTSGTDVDLEDISQTYKLVISESRITFQPHHAELQQTSLNSSQLQTLISAFVNHLTFVRCLPGQGSKTIISSLVKSLSEIRDNEPILVLTKDPYYTNGLTEKLVTHGGLNHYDIFNVNDHQYQEKLTEVANQLDHLQELFNNDDIYQLEQSLKGQWKIFQEKFESKEDAEDNHESYPLKSLISKPSQELESQSDELLNYYAKHFNSIVSKFKVYQDLSLFSKYKSMQSAYFPSRVIISDSLVSVKDIKFSRVIVVGGSNFDKSDIFGSISLNSSKINSLLVFDSHPSSIGFESQVINLKQQYTKSNEIMNALRLKEPSIESSKEDKITGSIEYVELKSEEGLNFKKFYQNPIERGFILKLYQKLTRLQADSNPEILIITPSETQKLLLQQLFSSNDIIDAVIALPDECKSSEFDYVILGTIRTSDQHEITEDLVFECLKQAKLKLYIVSHSNVIKSINGIKLTKGLTISSRDNNALKINKLDDLE